MGRITSAVKLRKLAIIKKAMAEKWTYKMVCEEIGGHSMNNLRDFMKRNNMALPDFWKPRVYRKRMIEGGAK